MPSCAPHRHEGADIGGAHVAQHRDGHRPAIVRSEEVEELPEIALVGFERLVRQPPHAAAYRACHSGDQAFDLGIGDEGGGHGPHRLGACW